MGEELKSLSLLNLRDLAKSKGMKNISKLNKEELINEIMRMTNEKNTEIEENKTEEKKNEDKKIEKAREYVVENNKELLENDVDKATSNGTADTSGG